MNDYPQIKIKTKKSMKERLKNNLAPITMGFIIVYLAILIFLYNVWPYYRSDTDLFRNAVLASPLFAAVFVLMFAFLKRYGEDVIWEETKDVTTKSDPKIERIAIAIVKRLPIKLQDRLIIIYVYFDKHTLSHTREFSRRENLQSAYMIMAYVIFALGGFFALVTKNTLIGGILFIAAGGCFIVFIWLNAYTSMAIPSNEEDQHENVQVSLINWSSTFEKLDIDTITQDDLFVIFDKHLAALQAELFDTCGKME